MWQRSDRASLLYAANVRAQLVKMATEYIHLVNGASLSPSSGALGTSRTSFRSCLSLIVTGADLALRQVQRPFDRRLQPLGSFPRGLPGPSSRQRGCDIFVPAAGSVEACPWGSPSPVSLCPRNQHMLAAK